MVIDGNKIHMSDIGTAEFDGERIRLPGHLIEKAGFKGTSKIDCWLLVVIPGRYRLLTKAPTNTDDDTSKIFQFVEELGESGEALERIENTQAAFRARLIPCVASPPKPGWRINFPRAAIWLVPANEDRSRVFVFSVAGYIEFWFPDTLRRYVSVPISDVLP